MSSSDVSSQVSSLRASVAAIGDGSDVCEDDIQAIMTAAVQLYTAKVNADGVFPVVAGGTITATDAMITTSALLRAVNVQVFELGFWQSWAH